jgi:hypothetical protein
MLTSFTLGCRIACEEDRRCVDSDVGKGTVPKLLGAGDCSSGRLQTNGGGPQSVARCSPSFSSVPEVRIVAKRGEDEP